MNAAVSGPGPEPRPPPGEENAPTGPVAVWVMPLLAGAVWGMTAAIRSEAAAAIAVAGILVVVVGLLAWRRRSVVAAAVACLGALCALSGVVHAAASTFDPVAALAREGASATVVVQVGAGRTWEATATRPALWRGTATLQHLQARGQAWDSRADVVVMATGDAARTWAELQLGARVTTSARLQEPEPGEAAWAVVRVRGAPSDVADAGLPWNVVGALREGLRAACAPLPEDARALVPALVVGDTEAMSDDLRDRFVATGLTHLTAVSGANLTLMLGFLRLLAVWVGVRGRWIAVVLTGGVAGFVLLCLGEPSVLRAAAMGLVGLAALGHGGGPRAGVRRLAVAVIVVVLLAPAMALSVGFALSVLATGGLLWWARPFAEALGRWLPRWLADALAVPLAAQVATEPVVVALAGQVSVVAVLANLAAAPFVGPATVLGLGATLAAPVLMPLAHGLAWLAGWCAVGIAQVARWGEALPGAAVPLRADLGAQAVVAAMCLLAAAVLPAILRRPIATLTLAGALAVALVRPPVSPGWPDPGWRVASCDVGQGDATIVRTGPRQAAVIDTGPDPRLLSRCLDQLGVEAVPLLILTHLHADHAGGLTALTGRGVAMVVTSSVRTPAAADRSIGEVLPGVPRVVAAGGERWGLGAATLTIVAAPRPATITTHSEGESSAENDASLLIRAEVDGLSLVVAGDAEESTQTSHARLGTAVDADVLVVPHHGSRRHSVAFFDAVSPTVALISVGAGNDYGHPADSTVRAVTQTGARVFRTDEHGSITVAPAPGGLSVTPQR